jgi:hypothetical protein
MYKYILLYVNRDFNGIVNGKYFVPQLQAFVFVEFQVPNKCG